jgi:ABC-2 type transport system permease protein
MDQVRWWIRIMLAGARVQVSRGRGGVYIVGAASLPVMYAVVFVLMGRYLGRANELAPFLVIGPALLGVWYGAILDGGTVISDERSAGTLELLIAAPAPTALVILGRVTASTFISLLGIPLVVLSARMLGAQLTIVDVFSATMGLIALAVCTTAVSLIFASTFVVARSAAVLVNLIPFPLYILSGILFPVALLPEWVQPLSSLIALTWVAELLRSSAIGDASAYLVPTLSVVGALAVAYALAGYGLFARIEQLIRANGKVSLSQ